MADELWQNRGGTLEKMDLGGGGGSTPIATLAEAGKVKPDGTSTTVDADGTLHSTVAVSVSVYGDVPVGTVTTSVFGRRPTSDDLPCDGSVVKRAAWPELFAVIGTSWNTGGEAADEFRLPNIPAGITPPAPDPILETDWEKVCDTIPGGAFMPSNYGHVHATGAFCVDAANGVAHVFAASTNNMSDTSFYEHLVDVGSGTVLSSVLHINPFGAKPSQVRASQDEDLIFFGTTSGIWRRKLSDASAPWTRIAACSGDPCPIEIDAERGRLFVYGTAASGANSPCMAVNYATRTAPAHVLFTEAAIPYGALDRKTGMLWGVTTSGRTLQCLNPGTQAYTKSGIAAAFVGNGTCNIGISNDSILALDSSQNAWVARRNAAGDDFENPVKVGPTPIVTEAHNVTPIPGQDAFLVWINGYHAICTNIALVDARALSVTNIWTTTPYPGKFLSDVHPEPDGWLYALVKTQNDAANGMGPMALIRRKLGDRQKWKPYSKYIRARNSPGSVNVAEINSLIRDGSIDLGSAPGGAGGSAAPATCGSLGSVQPDCDTITIDGAGVISVDVDAVSTAMTNGIKDIIKGSLGETAIKNLVKAAAEPAKATCSANGISRPDCDTLQVDREGVLSVDVDAVRREVLQPTQDPKNPSPTIITLGPPRLVRVREQKVSDNYTRLVYTVAATPVAGAIASFKWREDSRSTFSTATAKANTATLSGGIRYASDAGKEVTLQVHAVDTLGNVGALAEFTSTVTFVASSTRHGEILFDAGGVPVAVITGSFASGGEEPWNIFGKKVWIAVATAQNRVIMKPGWYGMAIPGMDAVNVASWKLAENSTAEDGTGTFVSSKSTEADMDATFAQDAGQDSKRKTDLFLQGGHPESSTPDAATWCRSIVPLVGSTPTPMDVPRMSVLMRIYQARAVINDMDVMAPMHPEKRLSGTSWGTSRLSVFSSSVDGRSTKSYAWHIYYNGEADYTAYRNRSEVQGVIPCLEIPA